MPSLATLGPEGDKPRPPQAAGALPAPAPSEPRGVEAARFSILIVDDDINLVRQVQSCLADMAELYVALTGSDAVRVCRRVRPDLVLLDLNLGDIHGLGVLDALRSEPAMAQIPVVVVSADQADVSRQCAFDLDALDWLPKPLDAVRLRACVAAALRPRAGVADAAGAAVPLVLAVDDDEIALQAVESALVGAPVRVMAARDAASARALVSQWVPDLVLLDVALPGASGFELAQELMAQPALTDVPIVFVTQYGDVASELRALEMGAYDFVSKPFVPAVLRARVGNGVRLRRRMQRSLQQAEDRWRRISGAQLSAIIANSQDAIVSVFEGGRIALANEAAVALLGLTERRVIGATLPAWLLQALPAPLLAGEQRAVADLRLTPTGKSEVIFDISALVDESDGRRLVTLTLRDQTLRIQAEAQAHENTRMQAESQTRQRMVSYLAHEIGNPLNGIIGLTKLMLEPPSEPLTSQQTHRLSLVVESAEVLQRLMSDTLALARWDAGRFDVQLESLKLAPLLAQVRHELLPMAQRAGITLFEPVGDLSVHALCDRIRLRQCLHNLLSNACKYGRAGGQVLIRVSVRDERAEIAVADDGVGMSPEQLARLYEPFERLGRQNLPGHGLGLAVTRMLAQAMGGSLEVESREGRGSVFTLVLPLCVPAGPAQEAGGRA